MQRIISYSGIHYKRSDDTIDYLRKVYKDPEDDPAFKGLSDQEFDDGSLRIFFRPFCIDAYIDLFGGENTYFISMTGGHKVGIIFIESVVDTPPKILFHLDSDEYHSADFETTVCYHLPKKVVEILRKEGFFK